MQQAVRMNVLSREGHREGNWLRDVILGGQDGLVNILGIVLGVSAASSDVHIMVVAALAAMFFVYRSYSRYFRTAVAGPVDTRAMSAAAAR